MVDNSSIINEFNKLVTQIEYDIDHAPNKKEEIKNSFRLKQIKQAIKILSKYPTKISSGDQLKDIKGIGKGIIRRIDEILKTGHLEEITVLEKSSDYMKYVEELENIIGIGRKTAYEFVTKYNIKSIQDLKEAFAIGKIHLSDNIIKGLKYYGVYQQAIPRTEIMEYDKLLHKILLDIDENLFGIICGSYRRLSLTSNDIDFLIVHPNVKTKKDISKKTNYLHLFIKELVKNHIIVDSLTSEDVRTKYMGFCHLNNQAIIRRIDIRYMPYDSYYSALLYFTGSGVTNKNMRQHAIDMGYLLNEYGLYKIEGKKKIRIPVKSEKDIFEILGLEYIPPENR